MDFIKEADVVVVGGGVVGCAILRELSKYDVKCVLLEKEPDVACGTTKANSAILHAGFDAPTGSNKAIMNVLGNRLYHQLEDELDLDIKWTGSLVVATNDEEVETLKELLERGKNNGVPDLAILSREEVLAKEPNLTTAVAALWAPTAGVCWPFEAALRFAQCAMQNGAEVIRNCRVTGFVKEDGKITAVEPNASLMLPAFMPTKSRILPVTTALKSIPARANTFCLIKLPAMIWYTALFSRRLPKIPRAFWFAPLRTATPLSGLTPTIWTIRKTPALPRRAWTRLLLRHAS